MQQLKDFTFRKQVTLIKVTCLHSVLCIITMTTLIECAKIAHTNQPESNFRDPAVWDLNSLYKAGAEPSNMHLARAKRSASSTNSQQQQQMVDACQSKMEVITPYYATNSKGKLRTIVNSELMQQAIQVETCAR